MNSETKNKLKQIGKLLSNAQDIHNTIPELDKKELIDLFHGNSLNDCLRWGIIDVDELTNDYVKEAQED